jgi:hypothetical protein
MFMLVAAEPPMTMYGLLASWSPLILNVLCVLQLADPIASLGDAALPLPPPLLPPIAMPDMALLVDSAGATG